MRRVSFPQRASWTSIERTYENVYSAMVGLIRRDIDENLLSLDDVDLSDGNTPISFVASQAKSYYEILKELNSITGKYMDIVYTDEKPFYKLMIKNPQRDESTAISKMYLDDGKEVSSVRTLITPPRANYVRIKYQTRAGSPRVSDWDTQAGKSVFNKDYANEESIKKYGLIELSIDRPEIRELSTAQQVAKDIIKRYSKEVLNINFNKIDNVINLKVGDVITLNSPDKFLYDKKLTITNITQRFEDKTKNLKLTCNEVGYEDFIPNERTFENVNVD